ncbi:MAG: hypothetical protein QW448_08595 [Thermofilaceae archaeon]
MGYASLAVRGKPYIGACGRFLFALLRGCGEELRVTLRLSSMAGALEAFEMAGLKLGSIVFTRAGEGHTALVQLRGGWLRAYVAAVAE